MNYPDIIKLASGTSVDGYGDRTVTLTEEIPAAFIRRAGTDHSDGADAETTNATVYLFPTHSAVLSRLDDLEGMYLLASPFGQSNWYKIESANVAERKLLNNAIDNVYSRLQKVAGLAYDQR